MSDIIFIKGVACPATTKKIFEETEIAQQWIDTLRSVGHSVTQIGTSWKGFYMHHVEAAFQKVPDANLVIVSVHGNIEGEQHFMQLRSHKESRLWAEGFYKGLAAASGGKPLNVFMISCGTNKGCLEAVKHLPVGSTTIEFSERNGLYTYVPFKGFLSVPDSANGNLAEGMFYNLLSKGYRHHSTVQYNPQIIVSTEAEEPGDIWDIWDMVLWHSLPDSNFNPEFEANVKRDLGTYFSEDTLSKALSVRPESS